MTNEKIRASRARIYAPPEGVAADKQVHVYIYDVFNDTFLADHKAFENVERAVQHQRHEQERIFTEQEAEPELFDLPFLSNDADLLGRVERDADYRKRLVRDLKGDARARGRRH
jgi:ATP:corrinoid adenosyltransferase